jgi:hypothetical protein
MVRRICVFLVVIIMVVFLVPARPALAAYTWYGADYGNWQFRRNADGSGDPIMTKQEDCRKCVASGVQAWVDYAHLMQGDFSHGRPNGYTQSFYWDTYFQNPFYEGGPQWGSFGGTATAACYGSYPRRLINNSQDSGVDPYGAAWGTFQYTPGGFYYHMIRYDDGSTTGYNTGNHSMAWTVAHYHEPVGALIDNGNHFVLVVAAEAFGDPQIDFWTTLLNVLVRDPWEPEGAAPYYGNRFAFPVDAYEGNSWALRFKRYGWIGVDPNVRGGSTLIQTSPPGSEIDDVRTGPYGSQRATAATGWKGPWWGRYVVIKRDDTTTTPDYPLYDWAP